MRRATGELLLALNIGGNVGHAPHDVAAQLAGLVLQRAHAVFVLDVRSAPRRDRTDVVGHDRRGLGENLHVAADRQTARNFLLDIVNPGRKRERKSVDAALDILGITDLASRMPNEISQGQRKLVSAARALAASPKLVCMDEPAAGLDTDESVQLGRGLRDIVDSGTSIFLVDHDMGLVLNICDYIYVIEFGVKIAEGTPAEIKRNPQVIAAYLGESAQAGEGDAS